MTGRDETQVRKLIEWIVDNADYGDISELCDEIGVDEIWFSQFYEDEIWFSEEDYEDF